MAFASEKLNESSAVAAAGAALVAALGKWLAAAGFVGLEVAAWTHFSAKAVGLSAAAEHHHAFHQALLSFVHSLKQRALASLVEMLL